MEAINPNTLILGILAILAPILTAWINRDKVPKHAVELLANSTPPHAAVMLANGSPQSLPAVDEIKP